MPALLLHVTLADQIAREARDTAALAAAAEAFPGAYRLGAVLPDLPYHARFGLQLVRHLLHLSYRHTDWGDILHTRRTGRLALALVAHLRRARLPAAARGEVLALLAGYLCHHAADAAVHPVVGRVVDLRRQTEHLPADVIHADVERLQSLLVHLEQLGVDICGTAHPRRLVRGIAGVTFLRPRLPAALHGAIRAATLEAHGRAPSVAELADWLWGVRCYGELMATPLGRLVEGLRGDPAALRERHLDGSAVDLVTPLRAAAQRTRAAWQAAERALAAERLDDEARAAFLACVPDLDLGTGY